MFFVMLMGVCCGTFSLAQDDPDALNEMIEVEDEPLSPVGQKSDPQTDEGDLFESSWSSGPPDCLKDEPSVRVLVRTAWSQAGLSSFDDRSRLRRLKLAGWLPKVNGGLSFDAGDKWDYRYEPGSPRIDQLHVDDGLRWDLGLSLDLAGTAYQNEELGLARDAVKRASERRDLAMEVIRLAFDRKRLLLKGVPEKGSQERVQLKETTAVLDAWTGGRFAGRWCLRSSP
jgi:hypothetical protein